MVPGDARRPVSNAWRVVGCVGRVLVPALRLRVEKANCGSALC